MRRARWVGAHTAALIVPIPQRYGPANAYTASHIIYLSVVAFAEQQRVCEGSGVRPNAAKCGVRGPHLDQPHDALGIFGFLKIPQHTQANIFICVQFGDLRTPATLRLRGRERGGAAAMLRLVGFRTLFFLHPPNYTCFPRTSL